MNNKNYYGLWAGSQSSTIVLFQDGRMRSNLNDWTQRSNHSIRKVHAQNYDIFSEPLLDYLNLSCCRQISASLYGAISYSCSIVSTFHYIQSMLNHSE